MSGFVLDVVRWGLNINGVTFAVVFCTSCWCVCHKWNNNSCDLIMAAILMFRADLCGMLLLNWTCSSDNERLLESASMDLLWAYGIVVHWRRTCSAIMLLKDEVVVWSISKYVDGNTFKPNKERISLFSKKDLQKAFLNSCVFPSEKMDRKIIWTENEMWWKTNLRDLWVNYYLLIPSYFCLALPRSNSLCIVLRIGMSSLFPTLFLHAKTLPLCRAIRANPFWQQIMQNQSRLRNAAQAAA